MTPSARRSSSCRSTMCTDSMQTARPGARSLVFLGKAAPQAQCAQRGVAHRSGVHQLLILATLQQCGRQLVWGGKDRRAYGVAGIGTGKHAAPGSRPGSPCRIAGCVRSVGDRWMSTLLPSICPSLYLVLVAVVGQQGGAGQPGGARGLERVLLHVLWEQQGREKGRGQEFPLSQKVWPPAAGRRCWEREREASVCVQLTWYPRHRHEHSTAHRTTPHSTALLAVALLTLPPSAAEMARGMAAMLASAQPYWRAVVSS